MANGAIDENVSYFMNTYPLNGPGKNRKGVTIGVPSTDPSKYPTFYIKQLTFNESTINPVCSGQMVITYTGFYDTDFEEMVQEGDAFRLFEVFGDETSIGVRFTGWIASIAPKYSFGGNQGTQVTIFFYNLIGQWSNQATVDSFQEQVSQGMTNLNSNTIPLGKLLSELIQGSLFQMLVDQQALGTNGISYNGVPLPVELGSNALQLNDLVWAYIAVNAKRYETLTNVLYPYQHIFYQKPNGILVIDLLRTIANPYPEFNFDYAAPTSPGGKYTSENFISVEVVKAAAMVPNRVISTLINMPFVPPSEGFPENYVASMVNPFERPKELYESGYFEVLQVDQEGLSQSMITDSTLMAYLAGGVASTGYTMTQVSGTPTIAGTYASRKLAQANFKETGIFITMPRKMASYAGVTPLGTMININMPTLTRQGLNQMYVYGTTTSYDATKGTVFTIQCCRAGAVTSYWSKT